MTRKRDIFILQFRINATNIETSSKLQSLNSQLLYDTYEINDPDVTLFSSRHRISCEDFLFVFFLGPANRTVSRTNE